MRNVHSSINLEQQFYYLRSCPQQLQQWYQQQRYLWWQYGAYRTSDGAPSMIVKLIRDDTRGSSLVEFTVTIPLFLSLMFGLVQAGLLLFTSSGLQHGVERAARCASVNYSAKQLGLTQSCFAVAPTDVTNSTIQQYAAQSSWGLVPSSSSF